MKYTLLIPSWRDGLMAVLIWWIADSIFFFYLLLGDSGFMHAIAVAPVLSLVNAGAIFELLIRPEITDPFFWTFLFLSPFLAVPIGAFIVSWIRRQFSFGRSS